MKITNEMPKPIGPAMNFAKNELTRSPKKKSTQIANNTPMTIAPVPIINIYFISQIKT